MSKRASLAAAGVALAALRAAAAGSLTRTASLASGARAIFFRLALARSLALARPAGALAGAALALGLSAAPASAATGTGITLSSGLASGTSAAFGPGLTCSSSTITLLAQIPDTLPPRPASTFSVTGLTFAGCTGGTGITSADITAENLPWSGAAGAGSGEVTVTGTIGLAAVLHTSLGNVTCDYTTSSLTGPGTIDAGGDIGFTSQSLTLSTGSGACPKSLAYTASYSPLEEAG
jgi:hypothetical protein